MVSLIVGILCILFAVYSVLPKTWGGYLAWGSHVINFIYGGLPLLAFFIGFIALLIGIANIRERSALKKEEESEEENDA